MSQFNQDPQFTAYALGEMEAAQAQAYREKLLRGGISEDAIEKEVAEIKDFTQRLSAEYAKDENVRLNSTVRESIMAPLDRRTPGSLFSLTNILKFGTPLAVVTLVVWNTGNVFEKNENKVSTASRVSEDLADARELTESEVVAQSEPFAPAPQKAKLARKMAPSFAPKGARMNRAEGFAMETAFVGGARMIAPGQIPKQEKFNREAYDKIETNKYTSVAAQPLSTFSVDVDTASYANMRRFIFQGNLPPKNSLRVEEIVNYFHYPVLKDEKFNFDKHPVAIHVDQAQSVWNKKRKIVRVALKADTPREMMDAPKNLVFLMDVSGSMNSPKKLPLLKESMKLLMRKLKPTDTISLVVYAGAAGVVLEPTPVSEKLTIIRALDNLNAGGSTNGGAGIKAAYKMAKQGFVKNGVNRVILATDGDFNVGTSSRGALVDMVAEKAKDDIFLTVVGLGMGNYQDATLEELSNKGNGNYAYIDSLSEANKLFNIDLEKNLTTVAKDVKIQVEFNPNLVQAYRLIGYENRMLKAQDFNDDKKDAGEMGAGHTVTALYEIAMKGEDMNLPKVDKLKYAKEAKARSDFGNELLTVKVRYKEPTATKSVKFDIPLKNEKKTFKNMNDNYRFAVTAASFALKLRGDELANDLSYRDLTSMAKKSKGEDQFGFREEMIEMIDLARQIDK